MANIPDEVIHYNILTRVPQISLSRFKCVCKDWYALINSSTFINCHNYDLDFYILSCAGKSHNRWLYSYLDPPDNINGKNDLVFEYDNEREFPTQILGTSNGLICCLCREGDVQGYTLCNLLTRECSKLIHPHPSHYYPCSIEHAFGYDFVSRDYKILEIVFFMDLAAGNVRRVFARVFSTNSDSWKQIENVPQSIYFHRGFNVVVNNRFHGVVTKSRDDKSYKILTFDLHTEKFEEMSFSSKIVKGDSRDVCLMVSSGRLYAVVIAHRSQFCESIWVMEEYGVQESWLKLCDLPETKLIWPIRVITYGSRGKGSEELLVTYADNNNIVGLVRYKLEDKSIVIVDPPGKRHNYKRSSTCIASLTSIPDNVKSLSKRSVLPGLRNYEGLN